MFKQFKLKSGLNLIHAPIKSKAATLLVIIKVGSKYETDKIAGLSHFLEHMFFKGTSKRPNTKTISEYLDEIGGEYNAFTSKEYTGFYAKVATEHIERAFDFISDILLNSKFEEKAMEREKGVIIEEMNMYQDNPMAYVSEKFEELLYKGQPAGRLIIGDKESISSMGKSDFMEYYKNHYLAKNAVICLAGDINESKFKSLTKKYFSGFKQGEPKNKEKVVEKQIKPKLYLMNKKTDQTHFCLGFRAYDVFDSKKYALKILSTILGETMSSRLFLEVRERLGLAYYIRSGVETYTDSGYFMIQAGVDNTKVEKAIKASILEFKKVLDNSISDKEIVKAKENIRGKMMIGLETSDELASFLTNQLVLKDEIKTEEELFKNIEKVNKKDVREVANEIFINNKLNLSIIGPHQDKNKFENILKI
jgi:predicted Zn-dependent peptidase